MSDPTCKEKPQARIEGFRHPSEQIVQSEVMHSHNTNRSQISESRLQTSCTIVFLLPPRCLWPNCLRTAQEKTKRAPVPHWVAKQIDKHTDIQTCTQTYGQSCNNAQKKMVVLW